MCNNTSLPFFAVLRVRGRSEAQSPIVLFYLVQNNSLFNGGRTAQIVTRYAALAYNEDRLPKQAYLLPGSHREPRFRVITLEDRYVAAKER